LMLDDDPVRGPRGDNKQGARRKTNGTDAVLRRRAGVIDDAERGSWERRQEGETTPEFAPEELRFVVASVRDRRGQGALPRPRRRVDVRLGAGARARRNCK
jgi:hypothetical protein